MEVRIQEEPHGEGLESGLRVGNGRSWIREGTRFAGVGESTEFNTRASWQHVQSRPKDPPPHTHTPEQP